MKASSVVLLALAALPFLVGLGDSAVWDSNEAFYVQTPREMVASGDWILPTFNGQPRLNKPPLSYWLVAAGYRLFGVSLLVERWITALAALACLALVFATARLTMEPGAAALATAILATTFRFLILSRRLLIDVVALACVLLVLYLAVRWLLTGRRKAFIAAAAAMGFGFLAKGPVACLPLLPIALHSLAGGSRARLKEAPWFPALAAFGAVASSWFVLLVLRLGWQPVIDFFVVENVGRFTNIDFGPDRGLLYYAGVFLGDFFPWSVLFVAAFFVRPRRGLAGPRTQPFEQLWLLWVTAYLVVFSLSHNKQEYYILPAYPAAALWLAPRVGQLLERRLLRGIVAGLMGAVVVLLAFVAAPMVGDAYWIPPLLLALCAAALVRGSPAAVAGSLSLAFAAAFALYLEPLDRFQPVPPLARRFEQLVGERGQGAQAHVGYYRLAAPSLRFYLDREIKELFDEQEAVDLLRDARPVYLVIGAADLAPLQSRLGPVLRIEGVEVKLYTTARTLLQGAGDDSAFQSTKPWTRPVYLVSNQGP